MKKQRLFLWLPAALIAAGLLTWFLLYDRDAAQINAAIDKLTSSLSKTPNESAAIGIAKNAGLEKLFAPTVEIRIERENFHDEFGTGELSAKAAILRRYLKSAEFSVRDREFISRDRENAGVGGIALIRGRDNLSRKIDDSMSIVIGFTRINGKWLIRRVMLHEFMKR